ncbi:hypothetical protein LTR62_003100 [Meristemomyces frigidus]|uniref:Uncharacterized protein n=1 Tax=Meristemomyces frigidus TaxID=1508187 RepID=A0AAN7YHC4_9PEZI|nr:hypothetical protein LTR62_003100 [Meristemomyces frigidus]
MAASRNGVHANAVPGSLLLVIHDFVARSTDELSLAKGDRIELIERDDDFGDGWFLGRHLGNSATGLFPEVYTTPAPKGTLTNTAHQRRVSDGPPKSASGASDASHASPTQARHLSGPTTVPARPASSLSQTSPLAQTVFRTSLPTSNTILAPRTHTFNADSPVMNETLSVINEHITDLNTPRSSFANSNKRDTMGSVYSTQALSRMSYIPGHETDEDDMSHTEDEVMAWAPQQVAEYLEDHGVERQHCDVFTEQEISGEVLLAMDQSSVFIKEFDLGSVGRRLKTWHKIKALQDEVRKTAMDDPDKSVISDYSAVAGADDASSISDPTRNRSSTMGTSYTPRGLEPGARQSTECRSSTLPTSSSMTSQNTASRAGQGRAQSGVVSPLQTMTSLSRPENTYRPSAQTIRQMQQSRRHSSIDSTSSAGGIRTAGHRKQPSIDKKWQPGQAMAQAVNGSGNAKPAHAHTLSSDTPANEPPTSPDTLDRGYFSDNATSNPPRKTFLQKKTSSASANISPMPSRASSFLFGNRSSTQANNSLLDPVSPVMDNFTPGPSTYMVGGLGAIYLKPTTSARRSTTSPELSSRPGTAARTESGNLNPVVTKLDHNEMGSPREDSRPSAGSSPSTVQLGFFAAQKQKLSGKRSSSDAVTKNEKTTADVPLTIPEEGKPLPSPARTGSTTPSTETRSIDAQKSLDGQSRRTSAGSGSKLAPPPMTSTKRSTRPKTKKATSAYTRGLEKITPAEQLTRGCDYSGWMKKKSGSLMSTWKPRLFILRGRRLSYFYSESDTEEKGLIDISFHRVLPATNETLTGLHAAVTGAHSAPSTPVSPTTSTNTTPQTQSSLDLAAHKPKPGESPSDGLFIFKLVPPKSGLAKGVSFTKPTVHYFAVNSRQEGRLWMAALMKATIDRDEDGVVQTSYNQKTISLAKARLRKERPPALKEEGVEGRVELDAGEDEEGKEDGEGSLQLGDRSFGGEGLGIEGLSGVGVARGEPAASGGADRHDLLSTESANGTAAATSLGDGVLAPGVTPLSVLVGRMDSLEEKEVVPGAGG